MEVAKTVLEVADVAWAAVECCHRHAHHETLPSVPEIGERGECDMETSLVLYCVSYVLSFLFFRDLFSFMQLHDRLLEAVNSESFLDELESIREKSTSSFPFDEPSGTDLEKAEGLINVDHEEPSWWVWVSEDMVPRNMEEKIGIDNENYVINLTPLELQKGLIKALGGMNKVEKMLNIWHAGKFFYSLATWGLALASLYQGRAILRLATLGVHNSSKLALKAL
ncbi:UNVERIFIED_CONTAM: hypothetical protein Sangu_2275000 [Sesamum angustifolium]|uniref:Uncharacterized protein n=1 Tax=Sesamum angustifolium TaxID=2727405 RepID=A0AAW2L9A9_9LAMI